jgi:hypothetical protein
MSLYTPQMQKEHGKVAGARNGRVARHVRRGRTVFYPGYRLECHTRRPSAICSIVRLLATEVVSSTTTSRPGSA